LEWLLSRLTLVLMACVLSTTAARLQLPSNILGYLSPFRPGEQNIHHLPLEPSSLLPPIESSVGQEMGKRSSHWTLSGLFSRAHKQDEDDPFFQWLNQDMITVGEQYRTASNRIGRLKPYFVRMLIGGWLIYIYRYHIYLRMPLSCRCRRWILEQRLT
jgi:hypothetical protein